ncbi:P-type conjugative transfer protein TrbL [Geomonas anaerohicana]|uniref:P-type conjugative transfer protein TrbL n=1 Tax=Geomonas anaerohicana TaxID=2798583 RepID=A0ABS0YDB6_9BACT|nr:P-type conjugative transfer protein TrbL [Geomonas anaerohicana]MBJ6749927.1 P-type conjugative transfer protein TrbL [Geomonas anaerohicana]
MTVGSGILTDLLNLFMGSIIPGYGKVLPNAKTLLSMLATLEVCLAGLWMAFDGGHKIEVTFLKKVMQIGFVVWVVNNYEWLLCTILQGFIQTGTIAGGGTTPVNLITDPSRIIEYGFAVTAPIFEHTQNYSLWNVSIRHAMDMLLTQFAAVLIVIAFFGIALLVFVTYLEFFIISALGLMLVPFGVFKHTAFLAEKVFGAIIAFGIRLMVLAFILSVTQQTLATLTLPPDPTFRQISLILFAALTIMGLAWHAPAVAGGLMTGSPSLGLGAVASTGVAVAAGAAVAGSMITGAAQQIARAGVQATAAGASGGEGVRLAGSRGGPPQSGGGGQPSATTSVSSGASRGTIASSSQETPPQWARDLLQRKETGSSPNPSSSPRWVHNVLMARGVVPHDTHSGGGVSVQLREV